MAFLDNSGDIILDAVLTDAGRQRMARGNFKIVKFALGDEEVNYELFNSSHPSGSAFYDLQIMQTPVLEAFTNNTSLMKNKLVTMTRNNILYLPTLKLNNRAGNNTQTAKQEFNFDGYFLLADQFTEKNGAGNNDYIPSLKSGILFGEAPVKSGGPSTNHIAVDQGIDSTDGGLSIYTPLPNDLLETAYLVRVDHRLLRIHVPTNDADQGQTTALNNQFVDDDAVATYYIVQGDGSGGVTSRLGSPPLDIGRIRNELTPRNANQRRDAASANEAFEGPLGTVLSLSPRTSLHVRQSNALFDELGTSATSLVVSAEANGTIQNYKYIDTLINIVGVTTGYTMDIPIRIIKKTS